MNLWMRVGENEREQWRTNLYKRISENEWNDKNETRTSEGEHARVKANMHEQK